MVEPLDPQEFFHSFEVFSHVRPMAGTYHIVDLKLERTGQILEHASVHHIQHFHDEAWLRIMGQTLMFCMSQPDLPLLGYASSNGISLMYKYLGETGDHAQKLFAITSHAASFLSCRLTVPVQFQGKLLEFPNVKVLCAYYLWKQVTHRRLMLHSMMLAHLLEQGKSVAEAQQIYLGIPDEKSKMAMCAEYLKVEKIPRWRINGLLSYWTRVEDRLHLTINQQLPGGADFLSFLMDALGRNAE